MGIIRLQQIGENSNFVLNPITVQPGAVGGGQPGGGGRAEQGGPTLHRYPGRHRYRPLLHHQA